MRTTRTSVITVAASLAAMGLALPTVQPSSAAPLLNLALLGRLTDSGRPFSSTVNLHAVGESIDYQLVADIAPIGTTNAQGKTINSLTPGTDGANSMKIDAFELATETTQVSFSAAGTLSNGFQNGTGALGGVPTARTGGTGNDLLAIRPTQAAGVYNSIDPTVVMSGTFTTTTLGGTALLNLRWASGGSGSLKINGSTTVFLTSTSESNSDPYVGYSPLIFTLGPDTPEPSAAALALAGVPLLLARRRQRT